MHETFKQRRGLMMQALQQIPDMPCAMPDGAFYVFPDMSAYLDASFDGKPIGDITTLATLLLEHAHAAVIPGDVFEAPYAVRFSYACSNDHITNGVARVADFLAALERPATA
jgi:aspartate aminotransferase